MDIVERKSIVARFLRQCNAYADGKLAEYAARAPASGTEETARLEKIAQWQSYKAFNEHALGELETDRLDHWFVE